MTSWGKAPHKTTQEGEPGQNDIFLDLQFLQAYRWCSYGIYQQEANRTVLTWPLEKKSPGGFYQDERQVNRLALKGLCNYCRASHLSSITCLPFPVVNCYFLTARTRRPGHGPQTTFSWLWKSAAIWKNCYYKALVGLMHSQRPNDWPLHIL